MKKNKTSPLSQRPRTSIQLALISLLLFFSINKWSISAEVDTLLLSAYEGNPEAQFKLALRYSEKNKEHENNNTHTISNAENNKQIQNQQKAIYWYRQAARQGMANAQYNLGHFYYKGIGVEQDDQQAIAWWSKAAHQGHASAQHNMGLAYFEGFGLEKNIIKARQWFELCTSQGNEQCKKAFIKTQDTGKSVQSLYSQQDLQSTLIAKTTANDYRVLSTQESTQGNWQKVRLNSALSVWVYKAFISKNGSMATLTGHNVRARTSPTTQENNIVTELSSGTTFNIIQEKQQWIQLSLPNINAWIHQNTSNMDEGKSDENTAKTLTLNKKHYQDNYSFKNPQSDDDWLFNTPEQQYTLQLGSFDNQKDINTFLAKNKLEGHHSCRFLLSKRNAIEWKYILFGSFDTKQQAQAAATDNNLAYFRIEQIGNIQQQRCSAWKTTLPPPKKLANYCVTNS